MRPTHALPLLAIALLAAPAAQAVFIETPLHLSPPSVDANAGDALTFDVTPANESAAAAYSGRTLRAQYEADAETEEQRIRGEAATVTLDDKAEGSFTWTIPAEVDDRNVVLTLLDGEEVVATAHVRVGDAEPVMYATGGPAGGGAVEGGEPLASEPEPEEESRNAPGFTALAILGGAAVAVLVLTLRRNNAR